MLTEQEIKTELAVLLLVDAGPAESQVAHREGRIRALVFALTGKDIGYANGDRRHVKTICKWLGWGYADCGSSGWEIDWHDDLDDGELEKRGVIITSNYGKGER